MGKKVGKQETVMEEEETTICQRFGSIYTGGS